MKQKIRFLVSLVSFLFLPGCLTMDSAPITKLYVIDVDHGVCSERIITDKKTLSSRFNQDLPLSYCDGNVSLTMKEFLDLRTFLQGK